MDVQKEKVDRKKPRVKSKIAIAGAFVLVIWMLSTLMNFGVEIDRSDVIVSKVRQGDLTLNVKGYGFFRSDKVKLITSPSAATVKELMVKPGSVVTQNTIVATLENPELQQKIYRAYQELSQAKAGLRRVIVNNRLQMLEESSNRSRAKSDLHMVEFELNAESELVDKGIVSKLKYQKSITEREQLREQINILKQRENTLLEVHQELINIEKDQISLKESLYAAANKDLERLIVRAGFDGVIQKISVGLGQSLLPGGEIALIGSVTELVAIIKIPQNHAHKIKLDQQVIIDNRRDEIVGQVVRIDPVVIDNTVSIEVAFSDKLPLSVRPQQNVDGIIKIGQLNNVLYIERPTKIKEDSDIQLYKLDSNKDSATLTSITMGKFAERFIQIKSGALPNQEFIISDLSKLASNSKYLTVNN